MRWAVRRDLGAAVAALAVLLALVRPGPLGWAAGAVYAVAAWWVLAGAFRFRALGPADRVTLGRVVLAGGVTALVADGPGTAGWALAAVASAALVLDGVDGWVARRTGTATELGARFDMEVDAFLILVLSVEVAVSDGAWVLAIGAMRYVFGAAAWALPWLRRALPASVARKAVAVVQGMALTAAALLPHPFAIAVAAAALAALAWSFGRDVRWLAGRRERRTADAARSPRLLDPVAR
nr:CDP-alcohol phosphatidyltransferase family protein [Spirillospora albida]